MGIFLTEADGAVPAHKLDANAHLCPAHPLWGGLTDRERYLWHLGYSWGERDAEADQAAARQWAADEVAG